MTVRTISKKGAMFGLDARIALAIFGALSVISGAALYSAIQQSKVISYITAMSEVSKGIEQYVLDTGGDLPVGSTYSYDAKNLVEEKTVVDGWNGPYISASLPPADTDHHLEGFKTAADSLKLLVKRVPNTTWDRPGVASGCDGSATCFYWLETQCYSPDFAKAIDLQLDGTDSPTTGKFRYSECTDTSLRKVYFQSLLSIKQD